MAKSIKIERRGKDFVVLARDDARWQKVVADIPGLRLVNGELRGPPDAISYVLEQVGEGNVAPRPQLLKLTSSANEWGLRDFQRTGVSTIAERLKTYGGAILADDMGLGKTRQAVVVSDLLNCESVLVVCPASVREQWAAEIQKVLKVKREDIAVLRPEARKADRLEWERAAEAQFVIVSYALVDKAITHAFESRYPTMMVMDEFHLLKGRKSERSKLVDNIAQCARYRLGLTGSPIWDRPRDLWKQLDILVPRVFGNGFEFDKRYCDGKFKEHGFDNRGISNAEELQFRLKFYMLRREKRDVAKDLPRVTHTVQWVPGSAKASAALHKSILTPSANGTYEALHATLEEKIPYAVELALSARKFLVFTWEKQHAKQIAAGIKAGGVDCALVTGDLSPGERNQAITEARERGHGVVATIDAAGTGVDGLQYVASTGIFHAIDWVPEKLAQAVARLDRIGQTEPVQWVYLAMRDSMDEPVVHTNIQKLDQKHSVLGGSREQRNALDAQVRAGGPEEEAALKALYESLSDSETEDVE